MTPPTLGVIVKVERLRRGWSQAELARQANMNQTSISLIESGRLVPYQKQLDKLGATLELDLGTDPLGEGE